MEAKDVTREEIENLVKEINKTYPVYPKKDNSAWIELFLYSYLIAIFILLVCFIIIPVISWIIKL